MSKIHCSRAPERYSPKPYRPSSGRRDFIHGRIQGPNKESRRGFVWTVFWVTLVIVILALATGGFQ